MHDLIEYKNEFYPALQAEGNALQWVMPFAQRILHGKTFGYDIGCKKAEWSYPGSVLIDPEIDPTHDAMKLPPIQADYIISSHCLEHLDDWRAALDHWHNKLKVGGIMFLYLPHPIQNYWAVGNAKHKHLLWPSKIGEYLHQRGWAKIYTTEYDLNHSFIVVAEKK